MSFSIQNIAHGSRINVTGKVTYISMDYNVITLTDLEEVIQLFKKGDYVVSHRNTPNVFVTQVREDTKADSKFVSVKSSDGTWYSISCDCVDFATPEEIATVEKKTDEEERLKSFIAILNNATPEEFQGFRAAMWEHDKPMKN